MKIDIFNHIIPQKYFDKDVRFRIMDLFEEYVQVICLANPPIEALGPPPVSREMAELANDSMAELVKKYPDRFPGFIASLPMNDPEGLLVEAERAIKDLGAVGRSGVQQCSGAAAG